MSAQSERVSERRTADEAVGYGPLWFGVLGGLTAWIVRLVAGASLVGWSCANGWVGTLVQWLNSGFWALITLAALVICVRIGRRTANVDGDQSWSAASVLAGIGVLMNAMSLALIVAESVSIGFVPACAAVLP